MFHHHHHHHGNDLPDESVQQRWGGDESYAPATQGADIGPEDFGGYNPSAVKGEVGVSAPGGHHHHQGQYQPPPYPPPQENYGQVERPTGRWDGNQQYVPPKQPSLDADFGPEDYEGYNPSNAGGAGIPSALAPGGGRHENHRPYPPREDYGQVERPTQAFGGYQGYEESRPQKQQPSAFYADDEGSGDYSTFPDPRPFSQNPSHLANPPPVYAQEPARHDAPGLAHLASMHHSETDPALFEQAAQHVHGKAQDYYSQPHPDDGWKAAHASHAQAYGDDDSHPPMDSDALGSAAAIQAFKMTAAQSQTPVPSHRPVQHGGSPSNAEVNKPLPHQPDTPKPEAADLPPPGRPAHVDAGSAPAPGPGATSPPSSPPAGKPAPADSDSEPGPPGNPSAPSGSPQDKLVALAMGQAAKLFDKKAGGSPAQGSPGSAAKMQAMQTAAQTAMRMANQYRTTGKASFDPGDMQSLIGAAMSIL